MLNLSTLTTPGVYIDEVSLLPPSVAAVPTGIPAFIGYTQKVVTPGGENLSLVAKKIFSMRQFEELYGLPQPEDDGLKVTIKDFMSKDGKSVVRSEMRPEFNSPTPSKHNLYYAMLLYFANGGGPCYIISVGTYNGAPSDADLDKGLKILASEDEPTMIVFPEAVHLGAGAYKTLMQAALDQANLLKDRFVILDVKQTNTKAEDVETGDIKTFRDTACPDNNLKFGAAYYPYLETTIDYNYVGNENKVDIIHKKVDEAGNETPGDQDGKKLDALEASANLLYKQLKNLIADIPMKMPPSAAIAGIYAKTDNERGVFKAPANVGVAAATGPSIKLDDVIQGALNVDPNGGRSVNVIRQLAGRGTVVWGARTLDGNDNEWRYISVRRFFNFVEESVKKATYRFVFEPNDANTWVKVRGMVENFLTLQWRAGALQGVKPEHAFFVRVGLGQTMTAQDILEGRLIVEIGMAVVRPAEFIVLRFMHKLPES
jgi:uncharacterized protein